MKAGWGRGMGGRGCGGEQEKAGPETGGCWWQRTWRQEKGLGLSAKVSGKLSSLFKQEKSMNRLCFKKIRLAVV